MDNGQVTAVDQGMWMYQGALNAFKVGWSPDSRWLAYYHGLDNRHDAIFLYDTRTGSRHQVTSGFYNDRDPVFDPDGKYLYYLTNRTFKPDYSSIDGTWIYPNSTNIAAVALRPDIDSPLTPRNDEVKSEETENENGKKEEEKKGVKETKPVEIQLDGFENRSVMLPIKAGNYRNLEAVSGKVLFQRLPKTGSDNSHSSLNFFNLKERKEETILDKISGYKLSASGKKILAWLDHSFAIVDVAPKQKMEKKLDTKDLEMTVDPRAEWKQIFNDDWRFYRDYFYDPNMHGVNWEAIRKKYQPLVDDAVTRWDVNYVLGEINAELNSSHTYDFGGDQQQAKRLGVGVLGVDWKIDHNFYQIANIIKGAPWDAEVRSPLEQPGVNVKVGDYILAVNGNPIDVTKDPWAAFQGLAGKTVILTVNDQPTAKGARQVLIKTLKSDSRLRHLAWIEHNREIVDKASNGQIGYIYVPNTGIDGQNELVRQFNAQFDKKGLIIDERFNSGGQIPDRFIELLDRPALGFWAVRNGKDWQSPRIANFGPKVMLINGWSGSGGDAFPYFFRERKLGPLVGMRTWGGLIGYTGVPGLIDGGIITVPSFRMYNSEGQWFPEGHGVDPDYNVINDPTLMAKGQDPQLEKAIQIEMQQLKEHPTVQPKRPPYQNRAVGKQN
jgi:tricorn protease